MPAPVRFFEDLPPRWPRWSLLQIGMTAVVLGCAVAVTAYEALVAWLLQWTWKHPPHPENRQSSALIMAFGALPTVLGSCSVAVLTQRRRWAAGGLLALLVAAGLATTFLLGETDPGQYPQRSDPVGSLARFRETSWLLKATFFVFWGHVAVAAGVMADLAIRLRRLRRASRG